MIHDTTVIELTIGDILITNSGAAKITQGKINIPVVGDVVNAAEFTSDYAGNFISHEEVNEFHEDGCKVFEFTDEFVGYWRKLPVSV